MIYKSQELNTTQNIFSSLFASTPSAVLCLHRPPPQICKWKAETRFRSKQGVGAVVELFRNFFPGNKTTDLIVQVPQKELQLCIRENRVDDHRAVQIYMYERCRIYRSVLRMYECTDIPLSVGISMNLRAYMLRFISSPRASDGIRQSFNICVISRHLIIFCERRSMSKHYLDKSRYFTYLDLPYEFEVAIKRNYI